MGVVDLFPFLSAANSLHPESLAFSTVCFSQELKFSSTFRKHELHKQGAFLALLLGSPQVCVGAHVSMWASCSGLGLPFLLCVSGSLSCSPSPWLYPLLFPPFPTDQFWTCLFSLTSWRPVLWQALSGSWGRRGHFATEVVIGHKHEETFPGKGSVLGRAMRLNELAGPSLYPTASGTKEWILNGHTHGQNISWRASNHCPFSCQVLANLACLLPVLPTCRWSEHAKIGMWSCLSPAWGP